MESDYSHKTFSEGGGGGFQFLVEKHIILHFTVYRAVLAGE